MPRPESHPPAKPRSARDDDARWNAITHRLASADGQFLYAVTTTGIFCRPSCPSRLPLRANVELFDTSADAVRAGFRACKRCKPTEASPAAKLAALLVSACRLLERQEATQTEEVAREVGLSTFYFSRLFKSHVGVTPQEYRRRALAERAKEGIAAAGSVTESIYEAGYSSSSRFYDGVGRELGMTPREARAGALGQSVGYAVRRCSLGRVLVAWTAKGVCDVRFGATEKELAGALRARFPRAAVAREEVPAWVDEVVGAVEQPRALGIPLDVYGTAFQQRVWRELLRIPAGETRTYAEIARAIGAPSSARAVAQACASNNLAVVVPCHRVVRADGALSGYRWGTARKKALLQREGRSG
jgi:AraC family transcriptional regulator of adaptative response/methylated-DNA-[protein]-cysteine methyltransferase